MLFPKLVFLFTQTALTLSPALGSVFPEIQILIFIMNLRSLQSWTCAESRSLTEFFTFLMWWGYPGYPLGLNTKKNICIHQGIYTRIFVEKNIHTKVKLTWDYLFWGSLGQSKSVTLHVRTTQKCGIFSRGQNRVLLDQYLVFMNKSGSMIDKKSYGCHLVYACHVPCIQLVHCN